MALPEVERGYPRCTLDFPALPSPAQGLCSIPTSLAYSPGCCCIPSLVLSCLASVTGTFLDSSTLNSKLGLLH